MPYTPTAWVAATTPLSAANLNNLETQHQEAAYIPSARMIPPIVRWVAPGWCWQSGVNQLVTANRIYYMPIYVPESVSYDRIGFNCAVGDGAAGLADLRIFAWTAGVPGALVLSAGTVSTNAAAAKEIVIAQTLTQGLYFLAIMVDQAPQLSGIASGHLQGMPVSGSSLANAAGGINDFILYDDAAYADPAGAVDGSLNQPYAFMRLREA